MSSREIDRALSLTAAPGAAPAMDSGVPARPEPPWVEKGMIVLPVRSVLSRKVYKGIGMSDHQMG